MSVSVVPHRDTIRIIVPDSRKEEVTRSYVAEKIVRGILKMSDNQVLACQHFKQESFFDLTFREVGFFLDARRKLEVDKSGVLKSLRLTSSEIEFTVVVHMFNPHVDERDIVLFLQGYCTKIYGGTKIMEDGLWTGRRRYRVQFKQGSRGLIIPSRRFALGANKGRLFIPGIPELQGCWRCSKPGHQSRECNIRRCVLCGSFEHWAKDCTKPKSCNMCFSPEHLFKDCPRRVRSYAGVVAGKSEVAGGPGMSGSPCAPEKEKEKEKGKEMKKVVVVQREEALDTGREGCVEVAGDGSGPHGKEDGGVAFGSGTKGDGEAATPVEHQLGEWGDCSSSQEAEMAEASEGALKRPLRDDEEIGTPVRRLKAGAGAAEGLSLLQVEGEVTCGEERLVDVQEGAESKPAESPGAEALGGEGRPQPKPPEGKGEEALLPGWEKVLGAVMD